jgi:hypothetical protein
MPMKTLMRIAVAVMVVILTVTPKILIPGVGKKKTKMGKKTKKGMGKKTKKMAPLTVQALHPVMVNLNTQRICPQGVQGVTSGMQTR